MASVENASSTWTPFLSTLPTETKRVLKDSEKWLCTASFKEKLRGSEDYPIYVQMKLKRRKHCIRITNI